MYFITCFASFSNAMKNFSVKIVLIPEKSSKKYNIKSLRTVKILRDCWCAMRDSNPQPSPCQGAIDIFKSVEISMYTGF